MYIYLSIYLSIIYLSIFFPKNNYKLWKKYNLQQLQNCFMALESGQKYAETGDYITWVRFIHI